MSITRCSHVDREHYAKGLCKKCYHQFGRKKTAEGCEHTDRPSYANKMCMVCYNHWKYMRKKTNTFGGEQKNEDGDHLDF